MGTVANPVGRATLCFRVSILNVDTQSLIHLNAYRLRTKQRKTNSPSLAQHRVASDYLFAKIGFDTAENEPSKIVL